MDAGDWIALVSVAVACFALWHSAQSREDAKRANDIADEVRLETARANGLASTSNAWSREANVIAEKSRREAQEATKLAQASLDHSKDVAIKQFTAHLELNFENTRFEGDGKIVVDYRMTNIGLVSASSFYARLQTHNIATIKQVPEK